MLKGIAQPKGPAPATVSSKREHAAGRPRNLADIQGNDVCVLPWGRRTQGEWLILL
jgi:hypothetical protein